MKLKPQQLATELQKTVLPLYWVSGDDPLLMQEACDLIRQATKSQGFSERQVFHVQAGFDWKQVIVTANSPSLFAEKTLIEVRFDVKKFTDTARKLFLQYLSTPSPDSVILFTSNKLESSSLRTKWFQQLEALSVFVQVWPLTLSELPAWIKQRLAQYQLQADNAGIHLLVQRGEGHLLALAQDIEKLSLLYPKGAISVENIAAVIGDNARFDVFNLVDAAVGGDSMRVVRIMRGLKQEGVEAILILWALAREIRMLALVSDAVSNGENRETALRQQGVWPRRMSLVNQALKRKGKKYWQQLLPFALKIDQTIKGAASGNIWDELEKLALAIAGVVLFTRKNNSESHEK